MTAATQALLAVFLSDPSSSRYGLELGRETGMPSGTVHPVLARLEGIGWLTSGWEEVDPAAVGRPSRRYYRLTESGERGARAALAAVAARRAALTGARQVPGVVT